MMAPEVAILFAGGKFASSVVLTWKLRGATLEDSVQNMYWDKYANRDFLRDPIRWDNTPPPADRPRGSLSYCKKCLKYTETGEFLAQECRCHAKRFGALLGTGNGRIPAMSHWLCCQQVRLLGGGNIALIAT